MTTERTKVAVAMQPALRMLLGDAPPIRFRFWDGSSLGADSGATIVVRSPLALRHMLWAPGELGLARAYVSGALDLDGDIYAALSLRTRLVDQNGTGSFRLGRAELGALARAAFESGALGLRPRAPREEARLRGRRHTKERDEAAIAHHYDISNDFYRLVLGETMTYSCAVFAEETTPLDEAQRDKYELVCRKLGLVPGMRLLDVGCGWGGMVLHAAAHHGVEAVGITVSARQAERARERVAAAGLTGRVEIRLQDYRDVSDGPYDAICSIGMVEHVGLSRLAEYFDVLRALLRDEGRLLNHGITQPDNHAGRTNFKRRSFVDRYVFPDGELHEVGSVVTVMQDHGFEVRDVESLREHYAETLRCWVSNLEANWQEAVRLVGAGRARVWRLYMAASALNFAANRTSIHQVLGVRTRPDGRSGMPRTRAALLANRPLATATSGG